MHFEPEPNDVLQIDKPYVVMPHPAVPGFTFAAEGRKGTVYQLRERDGDRFFALKVFRPLYRGPQAFDIAQFASLPGMMACQRTVLTRGEHSVTRQYPELEYSVLMPWVPGSTWYDILLRKMTLDFDQALRLATALARVLYNLERQGLAHCDVASGNVFLETDTCEVYLVDLEDLYGPTLPRPKEFPGGTEGYRHRSSPQNSLGQWCAEGDRFAGAVMLAEILAWRKGKEDAIVGACDGEHFFAATEMQDTSCDRYKRLLSALEEVSTEVTALFARAWASGRLVDAPRLREWFSMLERLQAAWTAVTVAEASDRRFLASLQEHKATLSGLPDTERQRVARAEERCRALDEVDRALQVGRAVDILDAVRRHAVLLKNCQDYSADMRRRVLQIKQVRQELGLALRRSPQDDREIAQCWRRGGGIDWSAIFTQDELERAKLADRRVTVFEQDLEPLLPQGSDEQILSICTAYQDLLADCGLVQNSPRVQLAVNRMRAVDEFHAAVANVEEGASPGESLIWDVFERRKTLLESSLGFSATDRIRLDTARRRLTEEKLQVLYVALWCEDDLLIHSGYALLVEEQDRLGGVDFLTDEQKRRVSLAEQRAAAVDAFRLAAASHPQERSKRVVEAYQMNKECLRSSSGFGPKEHRALAQAQQRMAEAEVRAAATSGQSEWFVATVEQAIAAGCELDSDVLREFLLVGGPMTTNLRRPGWQ